MAVDERDPANLWDLLDAARLLQGYVERITLAKLLAERMLQSVVERCVVRLGGAASRLSPAFRASHPEVPWQRIIEAGRHTLERYDEVDHRDLWEIASLLVPSIIQCVEAAMPPLPSDSGPLDSIGPDRLGVDVSGAALAAFCKRHHIRRLWFFGSVLTEDFGPDSDVDVLVDFEPGQTPGLGFFEMKEELKELVGRPVDLLTEPSVRNPYRRHEIMRTRRLAYAA